MPLGIGIGLPVEFGSGGIIGTGPVVPPNALLDEDGNPILDEDGNYILVE